MFDLRVSGGRVEMKMFYDLIFKNLEFKWAFLCISRFDISDAYLCPSS